MNVLVTGGFGTIGREVIARLLRANHVVRCLDLDTRSNRRFAAKLPQVETVFGDITQPLDVARALAGARLDAVIHLAALLPPVAANRPELGERVNVEGTRNLVDAIEALENPPSLVFSSSIAVMGDTQDRPPPRTADEQPSPADPYGEQKLAAETIIRGSAVPWTILRLGPCISLELAIKEFRAEPSLKKQLNISAGARVEWVSGADVATALANAIAVPALRGRILFIGGGQECRFHWYDVVGMFVGALGLGPIPEEHFGDGPIHVDWMDTEESEKLLQYQTRDLGDLYAEFKRKAAIPRYLLLPVRPLVNRLILPR